MSIFPKKPIQTGDVVIGVNKYGWTSKGAAVIERYFTEPSLVLEIKDQQALVYFEQGGPLWYDITKLERVYVTEEFNGIREMAENQFNSPDKPGNKA